MSASNPVAEAAVIAGLVNCGDPVAIGRYALDHRLDADCFTLQTFRRAYEAITDLAAAEQPVDLPILAGRISGEDLAAVDSACREHVSAANFPAYAKELHACKRRRRESAARDRLAQAAAAGAPENELTAILESIRQAAAGESRECRLTEIESLCAKPPTESWLVKRYVPTDSLTVIFGSPGCGKSFLGIDIACHVATGRPWREHAVKQGSVVYIAGEGRNGLSRRFKAWFDRQGEQPRNISLLLTPVALTDPASVAALAADIRTLPESPALVIVDTLNRNFGPGDENSTADMTKAVAGLDAIRAATGAAILGIHHSGHAEKGRGRGSSVLFGALDAEFAVEMLSNTVQIRSTKMKDADPPLPLAWTMEKQALPWCDDEGIPIDSAVLVPADAPAPIDRAAYVGGKAKIALDALRAALMKHGVEDKGVVTVAEDEWRQTAYGAGIASSDTTQDARRKAFNRARDALVAAQRARCDAGRYWVPVTRTPGQTPGQTPGHPDKQPDKQPDTRTDPDKHPDNRTDPDKTGQCPDMSGGMLDGQTGQNRTHPYRGVRMSGCPAYPDVAEPEKQESQPVDADLDIGEIE